MGDVIKGIGNVVGTAAPFAGLIPGIGPLAAAGIGAGGKLLSGGGAKGALTGGLEGAAGGLASNAFGGDLASKIGGALKNQFAPGGQLDFSKILGVGGGIANLIGQGQQRKSAQDYANAGISQRNALMSKILGPQNYGIPAPNLNQQ